jgi:hypothetical protein
MSEIPVSPDKNITSRGPEDYQELFHCDSTAGYDLEIDE